METSLLLARLIGPVFVLVGIGVLINHKHYATMISRFMESPDLYYMSGTLAFVAGIAVVLHHNLWVADWRVVITLLGWISVLKGGVRVVFPTVGSGIAKAFAESRALLATSAVIILIVGAWLSFEGFRSL